MQRGHCWLRGRRNHSTVTVILEETIPGSNWKTMNQIHRACLLITCCLILLPAILVAQEMDHVYLKNGSLIRGNIMEIELDDHVKIQDFCGNVWYYGISEVERITSEAFDPPLGKKATEGFDKGYVNMTSIGFLAGAPGNTQPAPFSLLTVNGWRSSVGLFTGAGVGIEFLSTSHMPLFLDVRYDLVKGNVVPYVTVRGGYSIPLTPEHQDYDMMYSYSGGPLAGGGIGLKIRTRNHFAWDIELLYRYQEISYTESYDWNEMDYSYTDIYNRIEIRLGFYID